MPPSAVKTIRQIIYYQYAKIISEASGFSKKDYGIIINRWKKLCSGEIQWSTSVREWFKEKEHSNRCIYCGKEDKLTVEHILPRHCGGEDIPENVVMVCQSCNSSKGKKLLKEITNRNIWNVHKKINKKMYSGKESIGKLKILARLMNYIKNSTPILRVGFKTI